MGRFRFSLDQILRWRSLEFALEETKLKKLGQEQIRLQMQAAALTSQKSRLAESVTTLVGPSGEDLQSMVACSAGLRRQAAELAAAKAKCDRELAAQKKRYSEAKRRLRLLEELRERKLSEWRHEQDLELETLAAESYLSKWNRAPR